MKKIINYVIVLLLASLSITNIEAKNSKGLLRRECLQNN